MKTDELQEQVFALVRKQVWHLRQPVLTPATHLTHDLGLDSVERVQLGIRLEYGLRIEIRDTEIGQWDTLADVLACVGRYLPAAAWPATLPLSHRQSA
ncbi:hypothetical protein D0N36_18305 [Hymenobacter lapidiphilus]|uniref:acyl carrier protein n=1 Tax=Hymenobacter sp. CCM 8763 TaxID=2303334 RepID=UPI000E357D72|nr:phosphopantetheine-binding protein [Hymenobacter sp. CCM 8763]RFP63639.1 hypothetical protein D0N36_18305 [Hymenobacter sp. CCM 8763]